VPLLEFRRLRERVPVLRPHRQDVAAGAGDADALVELLHAALDVVRRFQERVAVEDELDVAIELARLALDRRRLADRGRALDDDEVQPGRRRVFARARHGLVLAAVVDQDDVRAQVCRASDARQWTMLSSSLNAGMTTSTIAVASPPQEWDGLVGPAQQADRAKQRVRTDDEPGCSGHRFFLPSQALAFDRR
jgi:hypothetical protein